MNYAENMDPNLRAMMDGRSGCDSKVPKPGYVGMYVGDSWKNNDTPVLTLYIDAGYCSVPGGGIYETKE